MKYFLIIFSLLVSNSAVAVSQGGYYELTHLYVWTNGEAHVWVAKGSAGSQKCSDQRYSNRFLLHPDSAKYDSKFALLLSAKVAGGKVNMEYTCINGRPFIDAIRF